MLHSIMHRALSQPASSYVVYATYVRTSRNVYDKLFRRRLLGQMHSSQILLIKKYGIIETTTTTTTTTSK
jgi:hypothetical protein